ncbi:MAG: EF-hand domain-containing protein, partial [Rhodospirillales bacterium]
GAGAPPEAASQVKEQLAAEFKNMDANKDGFISKSEFVDFSGKTFDRADTNKDGVMTEDEALAARRAQEIARQSVTRQDFVNNQTARYLAELDVNKDGKISRTEFMALAGPADQKPVQGQGTYQQKVAFFTQQFAEIDTNKDGFLDKPELAAFWTKIFNNLDTNKDGKLTPQEIAAANQAPKQPTAPPAPAANTKPKPPPASPSPKPAPKPAPAPQMAPQPGGSATPQAPIAAPPPQQMR